MSIHFIKVTNPENGVSWKKDITGQDLDQIKALLKGENTVDVLSAAFIPVRTNNLINFSKDFFLPTLVNQALKIEDTACRIFASLGALLFDLLTFPIRLFTFIPRIINNCKKPDHPSFTYLQEQGCNDKRIYASGYVQVEFERHASLAYGKQEKPDKTLILKARKVQQFSTQIVHFIEMPTHDGEFDESQSEITDFA